METKSQLQTAQQRLDSAMIRLDAAIKSRLASSNGGGDVEHLKSELDEARRERERLHDVTGNVTAKLDDTIERLRRVIGT